MKKKILIIFNFLVLFFIPLQNADAYMVKYKEDWYKLFHVHYQQYPDDCMENIYWLEKAVEADFCNPLYADAKIATEKEWEKYRYLFQMHINLKLIEQHLRLGRVYDKKCIYFYDAPWKEEYLSNMEKALSCYKAGLYYWKEAKIWYEKANAPTFRFLYIEDLQFWEDERERIFTGELNYEKIINREVERLEKNISELKAMDENY
ncbi:MAG: hypothetical protein IKK80_08330 [Treponema sp.]|nr:hypothetical protein [Treponema sp.]